MNLNDTPSDDSPTVARLNLSARIVVYLFGALGIALCLNQNMSLGLLGVILVDNTYIYLELALFLSIVFLIYKGHEKSRTVSWWDWLLFAACVVVCAFLSWHGADISDFGWTLQGPPSATLASTVLCLLALEAIRRVGGTALFIVCLVFAIFPVFAHRMPGFLWSNEMSLAMLLREHALGSESILGQPIRVITEVLMGFLIFGSALVVTGGGRFFMELAMALLGRTRGGTAKVCILSSALFGSLSGSVLSNIVTTGRLTIPAMKRAGYSPTYAAAVESCASTGGIMMPPVMGAVAFIMADFLRIPYVDVAIAAVMPSVLFFLALLIQVDLHARKKGLSGRSQDEIPSLWRVLVSGWHHLGGLALLTYLLVWMRDETYSPYYAAAFVVLVSIVRGQTRLSGLFSLLRESTLTIVNIFGILAAIGMIIGSLTFTGVGAGFASELLRFSNGNVYVILILGALTSFVLGIGLTVTACYLLLAMVLPPPLIQLGLDPVAVHMFILYWGVLSFITPPVAAGSMAAAGIAGAKPLAVDLTSMRIGMILFIMPFMFALDPALILQGSLDTVLWAVTTALLSVIMLCFGLEGWFYGIGKGGFVPRAVAILAGIVLMLPAERIAAFNPQLVGIAISAVLLAAMWFQRKAVQPATQAASSQMPGTVVADGFKSGE